MSLIINPGMSKQERVCDIIRCIVWAICLIRILNEQLSYPLYVQIAENVLQENVVNVRGLFLVVSSFFVAVILDKALAAIGKAKFVLVNDLAKRN